MLNVLDSKKVPKSGMVRPAKPAVVSVQHDKLTGKEGQGVTDDDTDVKRKSRKRQLQHEAEAPNELKPKNARKEKATAPLNTTAATSGEHIPAAAVSQEQDALSDGGETAPGQDVQKLDRKRSSKADRKAKKLALAGSGSRSFLADVLQPEEADVVPKAASKSDKQKKPVSAAASAVTDAAASGLVKVVDAQAKRNVKKVKRDKASSSKHEKKQSNELSGSSAAQLLQAGMGLDALQVGLGGSAAWD